MRLFDVIDIPASDVVTFIQNIPLWKKKVTKEDAQILFVDDEEFPIVDNLREAGWNVKRIDDITDFDSVDIKRSHIIFIDFKGVGKILAQSEEGIGLIKAIKEKYKSKKRVILYSGHGNFSLGKHLKAADNQMAKNSDCYEFITMIESELQKL